VRLGVFGKLTLGKLAIFTPPAIQPANIISEETIELRVNHKRAVFDR